jgi:hypothetical protein
VFEAVYVTIRASNAEIALQDLRLRFDFAGRPFVGDMAVVDDVGALRQCQRGGEILLQPLGLTPIPPPAD